MPNEFRFLCTVEHAGEGYRAYLPIALTTPTEVVDVMIDTGAPVSIVPRDALLDASSLKPAGEGRSNIAGIDYDYVLCDIDVFFLDERDEVFSTIVRFQVAFNERPCSPRAMRKISPILGLHAFGPRGSFSLLRPPTTSKGAAELLIEATPVGLQPPVAFPEGLGDPTLYA